MHSKNFIHKLFDQLDCWRNFPTYQLERRADIFFALYLPQVLKEVYDFHTDTILPEFPVRYGDVHEERKELNKSYRIDYVAVNKKQKKVLLIELKTDQKSVRKEQIRYLRFAKEAGIQKLMDGFIKIKNHSTSKKKYAAFEKELTKLNWFDSKIANEYNCEILFIAPVNEGLISKFKVITFEKIAGILDKNEDKVSRRFAESLREWQKNPS